MKPENEDERRQAMEAARNKKTFQKAVAANDAFEFCRCAPRLEHCGVAARRVFARSPAWTRAPYSRHLRRMLPFPPRPRGSPSCSPACHPGLTPGTVPQGELPHIEHEHGARQRLHQ